ncbi:hypothetical protein MIMGU_mgv1a025280mg, partial [Erythranthe guttata]
GRAFSSVKSASNSIFFSIVLRCNSLFREIMGRGVSAGGGQSSLGYLFGSGEGPTPTPAPTPQPPNKDPINEPPLKNSATSTVADNSKQIPAGSITTTTNNYYRVDGQNFHNQCIEKSYASSISRSPVLHYDFGCPYYKFLFLVLCYLFIDRIVHRQSNK